MADWFTVTEAAAYLKVNRTTIFRWCREGVLPYQELSTSGAKRIRREDLDALLRKPRRRPATA